jgi:3-dehydro-L-gulonate 2-dehydrogenase
MTRIPFDEMKSTIKKAFLIAGMPEEKADTCAHIHTESSRDGVASHGLNRVERYVAYIHSGLVDVNAVPTPELNLGALEIYNGNMGPGILNAMFAMNRATEIAEQNGIGLVSLKNTTHWMRGGAYAWHAADKGYVSICWTNTEACMPPWGSKTEAIGNNPFCMGVPGKDGKHMVLDMAMSQYSYGKLWGTRDKGQKLPYPGGFDHEGKLTDDPGAIAETRRILPMGMWKGSGFAILLDVISSLLSGGLTTAGITKADKGSGGSSNQIFIAINPLKINTQEFVDNALSETIAQIKSATPAKEDGAIFFPGEQSEKTRNENMQSGIPVDDKVWAKVRELATVG